MDGSKVKPFNYSLPVLSLLKTFNCLLLVLSLSFFLSYLPRQYTGSHSPTMKQRLQQQCWDYSFYTSSGWPKFAYVTNPVPPETRHVTYKLHSQGCSCFRFFSILPVLRTQDTFALVLNFEVGHFARHFLLLSFFLPFRVAMKGI